MKIKKLAYCLLLLSLGCRRNLQFNMNNGEIIQYATGKKEFSQSVNKINTLLNYIDNDHYQHNKQQLAGKGSFTQRYERVFARPKIIFDAKKASNTSIETKRLCLVPANPSLDTLYDQCIFGDQTAMQTFANGKAKGLKYTKERLRVYEERWANNYPFSAFAILDKYSYEFYGHIICGGGDCWEQAENHIGSEAACILKNDKKIRRKGYCIEAGGALFYFLKVLKEKKIYLAHQKSLDRVVITSRTDNIASIKVVENLGFKRYIPSKKRPIPCKAGVKIPNLNLKGDSSIRDDIEFIDGLGYVSRKWNKGGNQTKTHYRYHYQFYLDDATPTSPHNSNRPHSASPAN